MLLVLHFSRVVLSMFGTFSWWAYFSTCNYALDICAPGYNIWSESTIDGAWGWYEYSSGTSMAAPFVTGVIAKIWSQCPACSHTDVEYCIKDTAQYIGYQWWCFGWGEVQAEAAYTCLVDDVQCCN
jgi:subtilisin family serine protease